jgi:hypothetical protein
MLKSAIEENAMSSDTYNTFSEVVSQFLAQQCKCGAGLHVSDRRLFPRFRAFWQAKTQQVSYPALLGQFRVELTERGYRAPGGKRPHWYGLTLRTDATGDNKQRDAG